MKSQALLTSSRSYIVAKFQLVSAVLRYDITVLQKVSGNRATNCTSITTYCYLSHPCVAWAGWFGQEKNIRQLYIYQYVATNQKRKNSSNTKVNFPILTPLSTSQISTRFHYLEKYPQPISVLSILHVTYSFHITHAKIDHEVDHFGFTCFSFVNMLLSVDYRLLPTHR